MSNYSDSSFSEDPNSSWFKIFNYIKPGSKVLDVGCSSGNFGEVLIKKKKSIVDGIELDRKDYEKASKKLRHVYQLNVETDDLSPIKDKYDYIYFGDVIEHLVWPAKTLCRMHDLLAPGGQLLFSIPNMAHLLTRLMLLQGDFEYGETGLLDKTHYHFYTVDEVERILGEAGFSLTHYDPVLKDLPEEVIAQELEKVGLKTSKEFIDFSRTSEASVYQIVGAAAPGGKKPRNKSLYSSSPVDLFQLSLNKTVEHYEGQLASKNKHIKELEKYAKGTVASYQELVMANEKKNQKVARRVVRVLKRAANITRHKNDEK